MWGGFSKVKSAKILCKLKCTTKAHRQKASLKHVLFVKNENGGIQHRVRMETFSTVSVLGFTLNRTSRSLAFSRETRVRQAGNDGSEYQDLKKGGWVCLQMTRIKEMLGS